MKKSLKWCRIVLFALVFLLVGCSTNGANNDKSSGNNGENVSIEGVPERFASGENVNIKVIRKIGGDDHTAQFLAGAKEEGETLGFNVETYTANGNTADFHDTIRQAVNDDDLDGVIISHGDDDAVYEAVEDLLDSGKKVVTFDSIEKLTDFEDVTVTSQDDAALGTLILDQLNEDYGGEANIVYLWVDGFPPMVRRNKVYSSFMEENTGFTEIDRFGVATENTSVDTQNAVSSMLINYPEGKIDAIFATWDAFAIGATRAITEAGRDDVKLYGIDVSNADLQLMSEEGSPWKYTAAVDPTLIGAVNMRILAKKIAGEETPSTYDLEASLISQEELLKSDEPVNMKNLNTIVEGWGESAEFAEPWMETLREHYGN